MQLSQEYLKKIVSYNEENGEMYSINNSTRAKHRVGKKIGCVGTGGYLVTTLGRKQYSIHRLVWLYVYGKFPELHIDHINGVKTDNRLSNLREATRSQNQGNHRRPPSHNKTGYLGVSYLKSRNKYKASIKLNGKVKFIGYYDNPIDASNAYLETKRNIHEFCTI